jgi:hypothetical protein
MPGTQIQIDLFVEVPLYHGLTVNGFQDDFDGPERNPDWLALVPGGNDLFVQTNGMLKISQMSGDPNKLLYNPPAGYDSAAQEV